MKSDNSLMKDHIPLIEVHILLLKVPIILTTNFTNLLRNTFVKCTVSGAA